MLLIRFPEGSQIQIYPSEQDIPSGILDRYDYLRIGNNFYHSSQLSHLPHDRIIQVGFFLRGGKGGFGSRLKAEGQRLSNKKRSGNFEACVDHETGRRIGQISESKLIEDFLQREPELLASAEAEKLEKHKRILENAQVRPKFNDTEYLETKQAIVDNVQAAAKAFIINKKRK
jgi:hypothetical protein